MGAQASSVDAEAFKRLHQRAMELTVADMYRTSRGDIPIVDWTQTNLVTSDMTVEALLNKLAFAPGGACVVVDPVAGAGLAAPAAAPPTLDVAAPVVGSHLLAGAVQVLPMPAAPSDVPAGAPPSLATPGSAPPPVLVAPPPPTLAPPVLPAAAAAAAAPLSPRSQPKPVDCVDLFTVIRYVLLLYEGSFHVQREVVEYWAGWDHWIEERLRLVPSRNAASVLNDAAATFFSASVKEMLATPGIHQFSRTSFPSQAISSEALLEQTLPLWCSGYLNLLVKTPQNSYLFVSQQDMLNVLFAGVLKTNLQGTGSMPVRKLGLVRKVLHAVKAGDRALQAFRMMSKLGIQSVAVVSDHKHLRGEISLQQLHALKASNFGCLLSTVERYLSQLGPEWSVPPLTVHRDATVAEVISLMHVDSLKRTHVWLVSGDHDHVKGVISLQDILSALQAQFINGSQ